MVKNLITLHGNLSLPTFFPDATLGAVKGGVDSQDLQDIGIEGLVVNTLHLRSLFQKKQGKIHDLMNWGKPLITDSGGFQVMSLIHYHPKRGKLTDDAAIFIDCQNQKVIFTPEYSIELQLSLGADILICLDDCTDPQAPLKTQEMSVERTINWAKRCKAHFIRLTNNLKQKPLLFGVVQGGKEKTLRKLCAKSLIEIGFDGYCYGGRPVNPQREFMSDIVEYTSSLLPDDKPKYAMGVGTPQNIIDCFKMGYSMFDCVIPTREARHKKLYIFKKSPVRSNLLTGNFYETISMQQSIHQNDLQPVSRICDCLTCQKYSRAYLYHLFKIHDTLAWRLATIHNLRFYSVLIKNLGEV